MAGYIVTPFGSEWAARLEAKHPEVAADLRARDEIPREWLHEFIEIADLAGLPLMVDCPNDSDLEDHAHHGLLIYQALRG